MQRIVFKTSRARYRQLADALREAIEAGEWAPGEALPPETDLCEQQDLSLNSVRKAIRILHAEGLIEAQPGRPWRVRERADPRLVALGKGDVVQARPATLDDSERYGIPEGVTVLVVTRADGGRVEVYRADECRVVGG